MWQKKCSSQYKGGGRRFVYNDEMAHRILPVLSQIQVVHASELFLVLFSACDQPHWSIVNTTGDELRKLLEPKCSWRRCQVPLMALGYYLFWD